MSLAENYITLEKTEFKSEGGIAPTWINLLIIIFTIILIQNCTINNPKGMKLVPQSTPEVHSHNSSNSVENQSLSNKNPHQRSKNIAVTHIPSKSILMDPTLDETLSVNSEDKNHLDDGSFSKNESNVANNLLSDSSDEQSPIHDLYLSDDEKYTADDVHDNLKKNSFQLIKEKIPLRNDLSSLNKEKLKNHLISLYSEEIISLELPKDIYSFMFLVNQRHFKIPKNLIEGTKVKKEEKKKYTNLYKVLKKNDKIKLNLVGFLCWFTQIFGIYYLLHLLKSKEIINEQYNIQCNEFYRESCKNFIQSTDSLTFNKFFSVLLGGLIMIFFLLPSISMPSRITTFYSLDPNFSKNKVRLLFLYLTHTLIISGGMYIMLELLYTQNSPLEIIEVGIEYFALLEVNHTAYTFVKHLNPIGDELFMITINTRKLKLKTIQNLNRKLTNHDITLVVSSIFLLVLSIVECILLELVWNYDIRYMTMFMFVVWIIITWGYPLSFLKHKIFHLCSKEKSLSHVLKNN